MKTWVRKTLSVGVLAAGALLLAPAAAHADNAQNSWDNVGVLNGNQFVAPVSVPVNVVGNAIGVAGEAHAAGAGVNRTEGGHVDQDSWGNVGIGNGNQFAVPVNVPVNIVGNSAAVLGFSQATGAGVNQIGGGHHRRESGRVSEHRDGGPGGQDSHGNVGILNGNQFYAPINVPINICGNSFALLGAAGSQGACVNQIGGGHHRRESGRSGGQNSWSNVGILNGNQFYAPLTLPVNLAGNSAAVLGASRATGAAVNRTEGGHHDGVNQDSWGNVGIANGNQVAVPINVPINICGNALGILGAAQATGGCVNDIDGGHGHGGNGHGGHGHGGNGHGGNGHGGPGHGQGDGNDNDGDHGDDDGDYLGDNGADDDDNGAGQGQGNGGYGGQQDANYGGQQDANYGDDGDDTGGRTARSEGSAVDSLTKGVGGVGAVGLGGMDMLSTLR